MGLKCCKIKNNKKIKDDIDIFDEIKLQKDSKEINETKF